MLDPGEIALLRAIAHEDADDIVRLVYSDWLLERGDAERAEFLRVQCEAASTGVSADRRDVLRRRAGDLLDEHRHEWIESFGLPLEDVRLDRGLIGAMRLKDWCEGLLLEPEFASRFVTLTELDLSSLSIGDAELAEFAMRADLPALRKLILSDNQITDTGAAALADAKGLPRLDTVYLFGNPIGEDAREVLEASAGFVLANLDVGERAEGYSFSPGETEMARRQYLRTTLLPIVARHFERYELLRSAMLCVAQYWADEADDAVHGMLIVSELFEPTLRGMQEYGEDESFVDPNVPNTPIESRFSKLRTSVVSLWDNQSRWDGNRGAIPLWAAFAPEGGSQEAENTEDVYRPAVMFHRHGGYEMLPMTRPHLDGIRAQWDADDR